MKLKPFTTFRTGKAAGIDYICLSGAMDLLPPFEKYSRVITYDEQDEHIWSFHEEDQVVVAILRWTNRTDDQDCFVTLSEEGDLAYMDADDHSEKIPGAGVWSEDAEKWGYMSALKQIGEHLYACGGAGQVYKRQGPDDWVHMDEGILQSPDVSERLLPLAIDGSNETDIYLAGSISASGLPPFVFHWNDSVWRKLPLPESAERITNIYVESEQRIWMCGANGTLLLGNAQDGFRNLSSVEDNQLFLSLCKFQDKIYLGSNLGLFVYDPADPITGIRKVLTGLTPELQDANIVDSVDDVLWSIGPKDITRFDGAKWERIHHPDNPHIGGATAAP